MSTEGFERAWQLDEHDATPLSYNYTMSSRQAQSSTGPPPQTFDLVPLLHALLARSISSSDQSLAPLISPKDLATEAAAVKVQIYRSRAVVESLSDIDRTVQEQEVEINKLERAIKDQLFEWTKMVETAQRNLSCESER